MPFYPSRLVLTAVLLLIRLCFACNSVRQTAPVVSPLNSIPECASYCVDKFIQSEYPADTCPLQDVDCLCRTNTTSGFTLGEAALRCTLSFCSKEVLSSANVYNICDSVSGALSRTHATITATIVSLISSTATATQTITSSPESTSFAAPTTPQPQLTSTQRSRTLSSSQISSETSPTTSTTSASTTTSRSKTGQTTVQTSTSTATPAEGATHSLNEAAIIGVSVATGVSGSVAIGLALFFCCRRMRSKHKKEQDCDNFEIGGMMSEPPDFGLIPPRRPTPDTGPFHGAGNGDPETRMLMSPFQNPQGVASRQNTIRPDEANQIGLAILPDSEGEASPRSLSSQRTLSQLLPDKPDYELYPEPLRLSRQGNPRPISGGTLFEEEADRPNNLFGPSNGHTSHMRFAGNATGSVPYNRAPVAGLPANPRAMKYGFDEERMRVPVMQSQGQHIKPMYLGLGPSNQPSREITTDRAQPNRLVQLQGSDKQDYVSQYWKNPIVGSRRSIGQPLSRGKARRSFHGQASNNRLSEDSDTSFETVEFDDDHDGRQKSRLSGGAKPLSPVKEAVTPTNHTHEGGGGDYSSRASPVKYPSMPRSASVSPSAEIISRPRIIKRDDVKEIQLRGGQLRRKPVANVHSSGDLQMQQSCSPISQGASAQRRSIRIVESSDLSPKNPDNSPLGKRRSYIYTGNNPSHSSGGMSGRKTLGESSSGPSDSSTSQLGETLPSESSLKKTQKRPPLKHKLTPSRRGADLILSVDSV